MKLPFHFIGIFIIIISIINQCYCISGWQSLCVEGKLMCNEEPHVNATVKLYDDDRNRDDLMDEGTSNADGTFNLCGSATDGYTGGIIEPKIEIYHKCTKSG
ncbi:hypothetical protein ACQ4LE_004862 [Meloidogyne hapla]